MLTDRELATVLAALRHWQRTQARWSVTDLTFIWLFFAEHDPLSPVEIDVLCDRLNEPSNGHR